ncbi:MAG: hypothetical protein M5U12_11630 [Verrucomicrobia bacterium]|nr:hypothetical protein [Verrucomicrobiota bacterium]
MKTRLLPAPRWLSTPGFTILLPLWLHAADAGAMASGGHLAGRDQLAGRGGSPEYRAW